MNKINITSRDFFLNLGATVVLYAVVISFINLAFSIINYLHPDILAGNFYANSIAWPISMLIVLVPILYLIEWVIKKDIEKTPEKAELWIRKWRIHLTVSLMVILMGGDIIALINIYLNGEISVRFIYKILTILIVGGLVGKYYFFSLHTHFKISKIVTMVNAWLGIILAIALIITGFIIAGSPTKQRNMRFDNQRIADLQNIQYQILNYWQVKRNLPATLKVIEDPLYGSIIPIDPEGVVPYEYKIKTTLSFELCANFALKSEDIRGRGSYGGGYGMDISYPSPIGIDGGNWKHEAGYQCFTRTIDPEKYTPVPLYTEIIK